MEEYGPFVIAGLAVALTLIFLFRFVLFPPRPLKEGELPDNLTVDRDGGGFTARYRWGSAWDYFTLLLLAVLVATIVVYARQSPDPASPGQVLLFILLGCAFGYALLVRCLNRTIFTITPESIAAVSGPLPALEKSAHFAVEDLTHVVSRRAAGYGTYTLAVRDKSGSLRTITDSFSSSRIPNAVARLIAGALPGLQLEIDHKTPQERLASHRKAR